MVKSLEELLGRALPLLESVYNHAREVRRQVRNDNLDGITGEDDFTIVPCLDHGDEYGKCHFRGKTLQIVTQVSKYTQSTSKDEWKVSGNPSDEIVATAAYVLRSSTSGDGEEGGDIVFQRAFHAREVNFTGNLTDGYFDYRPANRLLFHDGVMPLGRIKMISNRLLAFPNSHIWRIRNMDSDICLVMFHLVNPGKRVLSSQLTAQAMGNNRTMTLWKPDLWNIHSIEID